MTFEFMPKEKASEILPGLFAILAENMSVIAPTGNGYEEDLAEFMANVLPAVQKPRRQIIIIRDGEKTAGYFQYFVNETTFMMEEIQFRAEYRGTGLFKRLYSFLVTVIPENTPYVEAYANRKNARSIAILGHLGLEPVGENGSGSCLHFRGEYAKILEKYS